MINYPIPCRGELFFIFFSASKSCQGSRQETFQDHLTATQFKIELSKRFLLTFFLHMRRIFHPPWSYVSIFFESMRGTKSTLASKRMNNRDRKNS